MMCEIDIENNEAVIRSVVYYNEAENEYIAIERYCENGRNAVIDYY